MPPPKERRWVVARKCCTLRTDVARGLLVACPIGESEFTAGWGFCYAAGGGMRALSAARLAAQNACCRPVRPPDRSPCYRSGQPPGGSCSEARFPLNQTPLRDATTTVARVPRLSMLLPSSETTQCCLLRSVHHTPTREVPQTPVPHSRPTVPLEAAKSCGEPTRCNVTQQRMVVATVCRRFFASVWGRDFVALLFRFLATLGPPALEQIALSRCATKTKFLRRPHTRTIDPCPNAKRERTSTSSSFDGRKT